MSTNLHTAFTTVGTDVKNLKSGLTAAQQSIQQLVAAAGDKYAADAAAIEQTITEVKIAYSLTDEETNTLKVIFEALVKLDTQVKAKVELTDVQRVAAEEVAKVIDEAPENLNTLAEIAAELTSKGGDVTALVSSIGLLESLETTGKGSLVEALNEVLALVNANNTENDQATEALKERVTALETGGDIDYLATYIAARDAGVVVPEVTSPPGEPTPGV